MEEFAEGQNKMTSGNKEVEDTGAKKIYGLTGELALQGTMSKHAQQRMKKKLKKEEEEAEN